MKIPSKTCFVIPTYNEAPNVTRLLQKIIELYQDDDVMILIVDDNSPDGTAQRVQEFIQEQVQQQTDGQTRVHLLEGERRGLGNAYVRGIGYALEVLGAEVIVQMDADFQHNPADARKLLMRLAENERSADVVIGSRYTAGGAIDERWSRSRQWLSQWGNRLARWIVGLTEVQDCTSGFKAIKASSIRAAQVEQITVQGYVFQVVLLHRLIRVGAHVVEYPVYFHARERGSTKLGMQDMFEFFYHIWWLRLTNQNTFIKFLLVGMTGVFINLGSFQLLLEFGVHKFLASPIAIELSIISNFMLNNFWTFSDRTMLGKSRIRGLKYNLVSLLTLVLSYVTFIVLSALFPDTMSVILQGCAIVPAVLLNYFLNSYWTFREVGQDETD